MMPKTNDPALNAILWCVIIGVGLCLIIFSFIVVAPFAIAGGIGYFFYKMKQEKRLAGPPLEILQQAASVATLPSRQDYVDDFASNLVGTLDRKLCHEALSAILTAVIELYDAEYVTELPPAPPPGTLEQAKYRDLLIERTRTLANAQATLDQITAAFADFAMAYVNHLPPSARVYREDEENGTTVAVIDLIGNPAHVIMDICAPFFEDNLKNLGAFRRLRETIDRNFNEHGVPTDFKGTPRHMVRAFLSHTPLFQLFAARIPFELTQFKSAFRAHGAVFAPTDWGKTRLLEHLVVNFLKEDDPPPMFIMDSMGAMLKKIERLDVFAGRLKDRLVVLDPTDCSPPALNIFKLRAGSGQRSSLAPAQETELFFYLFKAIDQQLTTRQATTIYYMTKLMQAVPSSNLDTLLQLCESKTPIFTEYMDNLPGKAKGFFQNQFFGKNDPFVQQTKQQIAQRLYTIGTNELFDAMFGATDNKFDASESIQQKKIVLVNTSRARLGDGGSAIFGRYILAQCLAAAFARASIPERDRHLAICFVDEVKAYADEQIKTMLSDARQFGLGIFMATQAPHQIEKNVRDEIFTNTSLRLSGNFDNNSLADSIADNMQSTRQAIQSLERKDYAFTEFMTYVRGETKQGAVKLRIPMTTISNEPPMDDGAWETMRQKNRERYGANAQAAPKDGPSGKDTRIHEQDTPSIPPQDAQPPPRKVQTVGHNSTVTFPQFHFTLPCLLDTGATRTSIPTKYTVKDGLVTFTLNGYRIELPLKRLVDVSGYDGKVTKDLPVVTLIMTVGDHTANEDIILTPTGNEILIGASFMSGRIIVDTTDPKKPFKW